MSLQPAFNLKHPPQVITSVSYYPQQRGPGMTSTTSAVAVTSAASASNSTAATNASIEEEDFLTAERMAAWLKENRVLQVKQSINSKFYFKLFIMSAIKCNNLTG